MPEIDIRTRILTELRLERRHQEKKHGEPQNEPHVWRDIVEEELEEARQAYNNGDSIGYLGELIQAAASIVAWCEQEAERLHIDTDAVEARRYEK